jgi:hypothetical protein
MVSRHIYASSCTIVVEVIGATDIRTLKIIGEKVKIKLLAESKNCCFDNFIKCINETNEG